MLHSQLKQKELHQQSGAALLVFVVVLLLSLTLLIFALAKSGMFQQKIIANSYRAQQAFEAAEAGLNFGAVYLGANQNTIIQDANADGYVDSYSDANTSNVSLANGSKYTITYSNPTKNNFSLIQIKSIGISADGIASREVRQEVYFTPMLLNYTTYPFSVRGNIALAGTSAVNNLQENTTIRAGGTVTFSGSSETVINSGVSSNSHQTKTDVSSPDSTLSSSSLTSFFVSYFGLTPTSVQNSVSHYYQSSSNTNYDSVLNGLQNTSIWIEQTGGSQAVIDSTTTIGSATNPVILIINGDLKIQGSAVIYGYIYVSGNLQSAGGASVNGALSVGGNVSDSGNFTVSYDSSVLSALQQKIGTYNIVAGSWNDFKQ